MIYAYFCLQFSLLAIEYLKEGVIRITMQNSEILSENRKKKIPSDFQLEAHVCVTVHHTYFNFTVKIKHTTLCKLLHLMLSVDLSY